MTSIRARRAWIPTLGLAVLLPMGEHGGDAQAATKSVTGVAGLPGAAASAPGAAGAPGGAGAGVTASLGPNADAANTAVFL